MKTSPKQYKRYLYIILLAGTFVILSGMIVVDKKINNYNAKGLEPGIKKGSEKTGKTINELLLSANELTISEKTAFINLYLKNDGVPDALAIEEIKNRRKEVYSKILNRKIGKVKTSGNSDNDFFIKAVPK